MQMLSCLVSCERALALANPCKWNIVGAHVGARSGGAAINSGAAWGSSGTAGKGTRGWLLGNVPFALCAFGFIGHCLQQLVSSACVGGWCLRLVLATCVGG